MDPWAQLFMLGLRQHGVVTRRQAIALGIAATSFDRRVRREGWYRLHPGVWLLPGADRQAYFTRASAALLAVGDHALATGWSGLFAHGVLLRPPPIATLVVPWQTGTRRLHAVRIVRSRTLLEEDRTTVSELAVTSPQRCFLDTARTDSRARLRTLLIDARQRLIVEPSQVAARVMLHPSVPGAQRLIAAARDVDAVGADSVLSDVVHRRLLDAGLVPDSTPIAITTPGGRILHPDITFSAERVCIECDSLGYHGTQRGLDLDHRKDQGYRQAGWNCIRVAWYRFDNDWDGFERDVRLALATAAGRVG
ncbi:MAG: type IV toxin-antitoxin system AbiEi family antitoxin domain-containing protein [Actinobacteria bacterium]|nr:type IV toxin-antitoxin system AbiEi family antitoxin domain-containing protein [Actinomycetota bacterium]